MMNAFAPETDARAFRHALGRFATGIAVITIQSPEGPLGFTANSFAALSLDPALVLWSPARSSARFPHFAAATHSAIHVLAADQMDLAHRFVRGGAGFTGLETLRNAQGVPVIPQALARFDCVAEAAHDGGDHVILVSRVLQASFRDGAPLVFSQGLYGSFAGPADPA